MANYVSAFGLVLQPDKLMYNVSSISPTDWVDVRDHTCPPDTYS